MSKNGDFFALKRPCGNCPFRTDVAGYLTKGRVTALEADLKDFSFSCHKTVDYDREDEEDEGHENCDVPRQGGETEKHCAGALILLEKLERPSAMMKIGERLRLYDRTQLDMTAPVYDTFDAMREAQRR